MKIRAALIDLDGTLLDTAPELARAANAMLAALGRPPRSSAEVGRFIGKGIERLVERCLTGSLDERAPPELLERAVALFGTEYAALAGGHSAMYPGVSGALRRMKDDGLLLACVTNKAAAYTLPLLERFGLAGSFDAVVSGGDVARAKPDPLPYAHACERLGVAPAQAVVIGDSDNDVLAGRAAGCRVLCVPYGYNEGRPVSRAGCDAVVDDLEAAARHIRALNAEANARG